ncbi:hypothetical protein BCR44DRAFT_56477 [Catenaria anguillulae PL171]|uniref:Uncharacterized protein n=1 Tax=Catenaria anguillulae PL171 TaxID=765915 RepID=A0A1Y2I444_9FUNG|nr:hypothetical protein BCR44DRAFT_56477 [Catenaria anguillulae PL171]
MGAHSSPTPFDILPHELLIDVLILTRPSPHLPATSRTLSAEFQGSSTLQPGRLAWIHQVIFASPLPQELVAYECESILFEYFAEVRQVQSRLSYFLKGRLPWLPAAHVKFNDCPFACALAPDAPLPEPILTDGLINWLFAGPFRRHAAPYRQNQALLGMRLDELFVPVDTQNNEPNSMNLYGSPKRAEPLKHVSWMLVPDGFQLVAYFIRAGQPDLLRHTLLHLLGILPNLATESHPLSRWVQLAMDNRYRVRETFAYIRFDDDSPIPLSLFLTTLAALDWSPHVLQVIQDVFSFDSAVCVPHMTKWRSVFHGMMSTLWECKSASRAIQVMHWLTDHGFTYDFEETGDISTNAGDCSVFLELFFKFDVPKLAQLADRPHSRYYLGQKIVKWMASNADMSVDAQNQLLAAATEHDLLDSFGMGRLMWNACLASDTDRQAWVMIQHQASKESLHDMIRAALLLYTPDAVDSTARRVATTLLNHVIDAGICPTEFVIDVSGSLSTALLAILLFDAQLHTPLDLARFAVAWLNRFPDQVDLHEANRPNMERARLLGKALFHVIYRQHVAREPYVLTDPSLSVQSALCAVAVYLSYLILHPRHECQHLEAQTSIVPNIMTIVSSALAGQEPPVPQPNSVFNVNLVPSISTGFQAAIRSITTISTGLDQAMARFLFDQIHSLDPAFAKEHVCWSKDTCVWVWLLFSTHTIAALGPRLKFHHAVSALRRAGEGGDKQAVVAILGVLPEHIRESYPFLSAIKSLNATSRVVAAGLKECGWDWGKVFHEHGP